MRSSSGSPPRRRRTPYAYTCSCTTTGFPTRTRTRTASASPRRTSGSTWTADTTVGGRDLNFVTYINPGFASIRHVHLVAEGREPGRRPHAELDDADLRRRRRRPARASSSRSPRATVAAGPFSYVGPDGTAATFFTTSGASLSQFNGFRYLKYKAILSTTNGAVTPTLSSVQVCFNDVAGTSATSLAAAPATGTFGGTTTLSATLTSSGSGVSGKSRRVHAQRQQRRQRQHERQRRRDARRRQPRRASTRARTRPASARRSRATARSTRAAARAR